MKINRITLLGHKDHGKSTLIGNLLIKTGSVSEQRISEAKRISAELNKPFEPGFILDSFEEERREGLTIDTTRVQLKYKDAAFEFIDVPGHEELIKNMLSGASYADFALAVVSAASDEGIKDQTKRHIYIADLIGINRIIIAVNKMDKIDYDEKIFNDIKASLLNYFSKVGINKRNIIFIPISAYNGENIIEHSSKMEWYKGEPLIDLLYNQSKKKQKRSKHLTALIQGSIDKDGEQLISGKVLTGKLSEGDSVIVYPENFEDKIEKIFVGGKERKVAKAGNDIVLKTSEENRTINNKIISEKSNPDIKISNNAEVLLFFVNEIRDNLKIKIYNTEIPCTVEVIKSINTSTGDMFEDNKPRVLEAATAKLHFQNNIIYTQFNSNKELGKFLLYSEDTFIGLGKIKE
ncbi:MAG: GTP-binding protein [Candidatus Micrarchaeia archaeon]